MDEYRVASKGRSFLLITFAELLEQFGAPAPVVEEVRQEEAAASLEKSASLLVGAFTDSKKGLTVHLLRSYLRRRYPDRKHYVPESSYTELLQELESCQIRTLGELDQMLAASASAFELGETEAPPRSVSGRETGYSDIGVVRFSLAIIDEEYRRGKYPGDRNTERWGRWRKLLTETI